MSTFGSGPGARFISIGLTPKDNLSFDGVEATIFRPSEDPHKLGACHWALHTRTRASGSRADKVEQNETIRQAKAHFGGSFYNDWGGRNRHSQEPPEHRDASSRGLYLAYQVVHQHLTAVSFSLPPENEQFARLETAGLADLARTDPCARVIQCSTSVCRCLVRGVLQPGLCDSNSI